MRNQPNHPEVLPVSTANPIADVSLQPVIPAAISLSVPLASRLAQTPVARSLRVRSRCLFAAALADSNRGYSVRALNLPPAPNRVLKSSETYRCTAHLG